MNSAIQAGQAAMALHAAGDAAKAEAKLRDAIRRHPADPTLCRLLAAILTESGRTDQALFFAERAASLDPDQPVVLHTLGVLQAITGKADPAIATLRRALDLKPSLEVARIELAKILFARHRIPEAEVVYRAGMALNPGGIECRLGHARCLVALGRNAEAQAEIQATIAEAPASPTLRSELASSMNYADNVSPPEIAAAHFAVGELLEKGGPAPVTPADPDPDRPLRIAFLSGDLRAHSVAFFLEPILERLDRNAFHVACYSNTPDPDAVTARLRTRADLWREVVRLPGSEVAALLRADACDIAIDLSGLTPWHCLEALLSRPAPVQATYLGYPNTTGLRCIDYRIVDALTDPPVTNGAPPYTTESFVRLPGCFLCYRPPADAPAPVPAPDPRGPVTFGSFNALAKINPTTVQMWCRVLKAVPGSRLIIKTYHLGDTGVRAEVAGRFAAAGIEPSRVDVLPPSRSTAEHLATYQRLDIALDTFPYAGTTTTCEALWMGVPVVSRVGATHASRVGLSLLTAVGLADLAAPDEQALVDTAAALAADRTRLAGLRASLRSRVAASPLCDEPGFAARFGEAIRSMWREACGKHAQGG
ncbi:MAG: tetratricopeptide repeat protein [Phycisphaeraceae bacterium]|nr:tetratricopeptide repeat protein [Phycisphaeraceae bacterium]